MASAVSAALCANPTWSLHTSPPREVTLKSTPPVATPPSSPQGSHDEDEDILYLRAVFGMCRCFFVERRFTAGSVQKGGKQALIICSVQKKNLF